MTDKLHCPFCGAELVESDIDFTMFCDNEKCTHYYYSLPKGIWQALIDGKKAQDALKEARVLYSGIVGSYCSSLSYFGMDTSPANLIKEFDEKITSITKQD